MKKVNRTTFGMKGNISEGWTDHFWRVKFFVVSDQDRIEQVQAEFPDEASNLLQRRCLQMTLASFKTSTLASF